ncbi:MAG: sigma-54-dependent Fis family transcriptional regulator, partial [Myxococcales bacterium]|nr:sigma-54-dependent Fis family transcriptional regulator [Myxococcales bacterium]
ESGSGKELVAEAIHAASSRAERPFVRVNCAALVETLLSSELFGHERGAFTGADRQKKGRFELADGGTILLDEIGDISPRMQAALLRVLQEKTFERVGGTRTQRVDVRVIAATHRDLAELVAAGTFREDLYYRLRGITVRVPSLRERLGDLPGLSRHLLGKIAGESGVAAKMLAPDALDRLGQHAWPGNVRELENALRSASVMSVGSLLTAADFEALAPSRSTLPPPGEASLGAMMYEHVRDGGSIYDLRKRLERDLIERALGECEGNISKAADLLGMKRPRLSKLVNEWGLKK